MTMIVGNHAIFYPAIIWIGMNINENIQIEMPSRVHFENTIIAVFLIL